MKTHENWKGSASKERVGRDESYRTRPFDARLSSGSSSWITNYKVQFRSIRTFLTLALLIMAGSHAGALAPFATIFFQP